MPSPHDYGVAFGLVIMAGGCTSLGASAVFFIQKANPRFLAGSLGFSAGVMIYVSFVDIFTGKTFDSFSDAGYTDAESVRYGTFAFFAGMFVLFLLDQLVHFIMYFVAKSGHHARHAFGHDAPVPVGHLSCHACTDSIAYSSGLSKGAGADTFSLKHAPLPDHAAAAAGTPSAAPGTIVLSLQEAARQLPVQGSSPDGTGRASQAGSNHGGRVSAGGAESVVITPLAAEMEADKLKRQGLGRMGLLAALAISLHNLPEGLATFISYLADPTAGIVIAIAIALHNIPEGIVVAMPIAYASGSKWKGFMWASLSGLSEPIGALIGYAIVKGGSADLHPLVYAIMFGIVGGMMVWISISELLPTAFKYDPQDSVTTWCVLCGMVIMAASILVIEAS